MVSPDVLLATEVLNALAPHIAVLDSRGTIVLANTAWCRFAKSGGANPRDDCYVGRSYPAVCRNAVNAGDVTAGAALSGIEAVLRGEHDDFSLEYPCPTPDQVRWFRMSANRFAFGSEPHLVVAHEEITAERQSERARQDSEHLLQTVLEALPVGVWILDASGRIVRGNAAGIRIWAGGRYVGPGEFGEYKGWWVSTGTRIAPDEWAAARAIRSGETSIDEEVEIESFDGTRKIILNSAVPLFDTDHRITGAIIVNHEITARKHGCCANRPI
jgi:PAS domain-containing protein